MNGSGQTTQNNLINFPVGKVTRNPIKRNIEAESTTKWGGNGGNGDGFKTRVAVLENSVKNIDSNIADIRQDIRDVRGDIQGTTRWGIGLLLTITLALSGALWGVYYNLDKSLGRNGLVLSEVKTNQVNIMQDQSRLVERFDQLLMALMVSRPASNSAVKDEPENEQVNEDGNEP